MSKEFSKVVEDRRSYYVIDKKVSISKEKISEIIAHGVKHVPTAFNSQNARAIVLFGEEHDKLWEITREELRKVVDADNFSATSDKIDSFKNGFGTVLYFEDISIVEGLQAQFPLYKDNFPIWSLQAGGMLQYIVWASLNDAGLGASLQHYNPLIDEKVREQWGIPKEWKLTAQMPFGNPAAEPGEKAYAPIDAAFKVFG